MNLFVRLQQKYQHFVLSKVPKPLHHLRFLVILLVILSVPVTLLLTQTSQDLRQRASYTDNNNIGIIINPSPFPSISQAIPSPYPTSTPSYSPSPSFPVTPTPITNAPFITQITYPMCEKASCDLSQATCSWLPVRDTATYMIRITDTYSGQLIAASKTEATTLIYNFPVITGNTYSCTLVAYNKDGKALDTSTTNLLIQINSITPIPTGPSTPTPTYGYPTPYPTKPYPTGFLLTPTPTYGYPTPFPSKPYPSSFPATPSAYPTYAVSGTPTPFPTKPGAKFACDFNKDGTLDISDYTIWLNQFINGGKPLSPLSADCNGNGQVDIYDYNLLLRELRGIYQ